VGIATVAERSLPYPFWLKEIFENSNRIKEMLKIFFI
jgi:hypothetical protein